MASVAIDLGNRYGSRFISSLNVELVSPPIIVHPVLGRGAPVSLAAWRERLAEVRRASVGRPGIYLDRSQAGSGKTFADMTALQLVERGLVIVPTHDNCREVVHQLGASGLTAAAYPERHTDLADSKSANCWNAEADEAEQMGLPIMQTICRTCQNLAECRHHGYVGQVTAAGYAPVVVATHARAKWTGLAEMGRQRSYWAIHEAAVDLLRPTAELSESDLELARAVLERLLVDPRWLNYFGAGDDDKERQYRQAQFEFIQHLDAVAARMAAELESADRTKRIHPLPGKPPPAGIERVLFLVSREAHCRFVGQPWKPLVASAAGQLYVSGIIVNDCHAKDDQMPRIQRSKRVVTVWANEVPESATAWFCDATATQQRLAGLVGREVLDQTPDGYLELQRRTVQIPRDVTRRTSGGVMQGLLRGLMADYASASHIGVVCHRVHVPAVEQLEPIFRNRIAKIAYFGSGEDRASNDWYRRCDLIIVAGTPRVPPSAIESYLIQVGEFEAAGDAGCWRPTQWTGTTETGESQVVESSGYANPLWSQAYRELVVATLIQAVGRGRGVMPNGVEVVVLTNEDCGLLLSSTDLEIVSETDAAIVAAVHRLTAESLHESGATAESPKIYILRKTAVSRKSAVTTQALASDLHLSEKHVRDRAAYLERRGLIQRVGQRQGWVPKYWAERATPSSNQELATPA